jgi:hypothetical protein
MKKLFSKLFSVADSPRTWGSVIGWWELRRIPFNLVVGIVGFVNLMAFAYINDVLLQPYLPFEERDWEPLSVLIFILLANVCYTGGWVVELLIRKVFKRNATRFGPIAFGVGLGVSVLTTFLPPVMDGVRWVRFKFQ